MTTIYYTNAVYNDSHKTTTSHNINQSLSDCECEKR